MFNNYYQQNGNNWGQKKQSPPIKEKFKVITTRKDGSRHFYGAALPAVETSEPLHHLGYGADTD